MELILSSGFLAFARHCGVIDAIVQKNIQIDGLCGTSSGALVGALWLAGHSPDDIEAELMRLTPYRMLALSYTPWRGLLSMRRMQRRLESLLPLSFSELRLPFGVGVCHQKQGHLILKTGHLPSAVAASCAMPYIFSPVQVDDTLYYDGGTLDRLGAAAWRKDRHGQAIVHAVNRTAGAALEAGLEQATVIRTPRSGASFFSLGPFHEQRLEARRIATATLSGF